jgi:hypothetical protein
MSRQTGIPGNEITTSGYQSRTRVWRNSSGGASGPVTLYAIDRTDSSPKIGCAPGTIQGLLPKIWDGSSLVPITADPAPALAVTAAGFAWIEVEVNRNGTILQVRFKIGASPPAERGPADEYDTASENTAQNAAADAGLGVRLIAQITYTSGPPAAIGISHLNTGSKGYELASDDAHRFWKESD